VVPSLNKTEFIGRTLQSIVDQKYPNIEVIILDGGSTDGTVEIIKDYASKYSWISWESKKDKGQVDAIDKGLEKASGQILTYINADDIYQADALIKVGKYFTKNSGTLWLAGKGDIIDENGIRIANIIGKYKNHLLLLNNYSWLLTVNYLIQPSVFISKEAYQKYGPFSGTKASVMEYDLWLKLGKIAMPKILDEYLSSFRLFRGSISTANFKQLLMEDEKIAEKYTANQLILAFHYLHNIGRIVVLYLLGVL